jgi:hypothetical protein
MLFPECVIVVDAHKRDPFPVANFRYLKQTLKDICPVKLALHDKAGKLAARSLGRDVIVISDHDIFEAIRHSKDNRGMVRLGNRDLKNIAMVRKLPRPATFIVIEYDVLCTADPAATFAQLIRDFAGHDQAVSHFNTFTNVPKWDWWTSLRPPAGVRVDGGEMYKSFIPLQIFNRRMIGACEAALAAGWRGHDEVLVPTIAMRHGFRVLDMSHPKYGYTTYPYFGIKLPEKLDVPDLPPFIHPIKTFGAFDKLPERIRRTCIENGFPARPDLVPPLRARVSPRRWLRFLWSKASSHGFP